MNPTPNAQATLFEPLVAALTAGRYLRVVARPGWVTGDPAFGPCLPLPDTAWSAEQHARAHAACATQISVAQGVHAIACGDGIAVSWVPQAFLPADLVREQVISVLGMRLLSAALALGRNVLVTGSYNAALPLMYALVGEGARPALVGEHVAVPRRWLRLRDLDEARTAHADRIAACALPTAAIVELTCGLCGVVAYSPSRRLDQALMRYELGAVGLRGDGRTAPLHVLAGIDLVVQVSVQGTCQVTQISEIALTEAGYRPQILFSAGLPPTPQALIPQAPPSFVYELAQAGHVGLAEELSQLAPASAAPPSPATPSPPARHAERAPRPSERAARPAPPMRPWPTPRMVPKDTDMTPPDSLPGWELDRLPAPEAEVGMVGSASADDAVLAATYGLAPPPRPSSARGARTFDDVMARAQPAPVPPPLPSVSPHDASGDDEPLAYLPPDDGDERDDDDPQDPRP